MKSLNTKIIAILIISFLIQIIIVGSLYRLVISKNIIADINGYSGARQKVLQNAITKIEKATGQKAKMEAILKDFSKRLGVGFIVKDMDGNNVFSDFSGQKNNNIQEIGFVRSNKKTLYVIYAYFPIKVRSFVKYVPIKGIRLSLIIIVLLISLVTSFLIYEIFAIPLRKLRKAMNNISYGNTVTEIPYYGKDELGLLCRNFEEMGSRLKKSEENQIELVQAISHDLKTPMTSIIGYTSRLIEGKAASEEKKKEYYEIINRKTNDIRMLLNDLEEYASIGSGVKYDFQPVDCGEFLTDMSRDMKYEVEQKGGNFSCISRIHSQYQMLIDESKIRRVFNNIVENSFKYAGEGCRIKLEAYISEKSVVFEICDNGPGVPKDQLDKIFNKFYRIDTSRSRDKGGTGLGLAICRGIVEGHGGEIYAKSDNGEGLCICFTLPVKK